MFFAWYEAPFTRLQLAANADGLKFLLFAGEKHARDPVPEGWIESERELAEPIRQLDEWFAGERTQFDLKLAPDGTPFQKSVWKVLSTIPYGETMTYGEVAEAIGRPAAARAVGAANGQNPISIIVPCHRVIGSSGKLVGFGGGLDTKRALLAHEQQYSLNSQPTLFA